MAAAALAVATASTLAASAGAARWRASTALDPPGPPVSDPAIGFGGRGHGLAIWETRPGEPQGVSLRVAERTPGGSWLGARPAGDALVGGYVSRAIGRRRAVQLPQQPLSGGPGGTNPAIVHVVEVDASGARSSVELDPGHEVESFSSALGATRDGRLLLAWTRAERRDRGVYVRFGTAGGELDAVERLARAGLALAAAVNERGDAAVLWAEEDGRLKARVRRAGDGFGPRLDVGDFETEYFDASAGFGEASVAVGPSGQVAAGWTFDTLRETEDGTGEPLFQDFFAAAAPPGGRFGEPRRLERSRYTDDTSVEALVTSRGVPLVAWGGGGVKYSVAEEGRFGGRRALAGRGDDLAAATGPRGTAALVWLSGAADSSRGLRGSVLSARSRRFGRAEAVPPGGRRVRDPAVAFDPRRRVPTAVWVAADARGETIRASVRR